MDDQTEAYLLLLLADGNLPTGSFVASSGMESYIKHGLFTSSPSHVAGARSSAALVNQHVVDFIKDSLSSYARSALPFVSDAHRIMTELSSSMPCDSPASASEAKGSDTALQRLQALDDLYHSMNLNDVLRRASKAQGVALLTLYSKGFSRPQLDSDRRVTMNDDRISKFVETFKTEIRAEEVHGHVPVCWGILTAALGLSLERSQYLNLFLQARSLLSAAIRLNTIGPYAAQQILLHSVKEIVDACMSCRNIETGLRWIREDPVRKEVENSEGLAASTWPLGEILAARHDLQHSRIFNS